MSKAEKTRKLLDELDCQACGRMLEIQTKGICAPSCGSEYRLNDEIELELSELESKATKWDDPQTQEWIKQLEWLNTDERTADAGYFKYSYVICDIACALVDEGIKGNQYNKGKLRGLREAHIAVGNDKELKAAIKQYRDPQTQADLELAAAIKELSESEATIYFEINGEMIGFPEISDFISWHKDQKGGQDD